MLKLIQKSPIALFSVLFIMLYTSCSKDVITLVEFTENFTIQVEGDSKYQLEINTSEIVQQDKIIKLKISHSSELMIGDNLDLFLSSTIVNDTITVIIPEGESSFLIDIQSNEDFTEELVETITFEIIEVSPGLLIGCKSSFVYNLLDKEIIIVAHYPFDGNANDEAAENHGILIGTNPTTNRHGEANKAIELNGTSDYIRIPHSEIINFNNNQNFTISFWINARDQQLDGSGPSNEVICKWDYNLSRPYPYVVSYHNRFGDLSKDNAYTLRCKRYNGSGVFPDPNSFTQTTSSLVCNDDKWHHIIMIRDAVSNKLYYYQNGDLIDTVNDVIEGETKNNVDLLIGCRFPGGRHFAGKIDDLKIFNKVLTTSEISILFKE